MEGEGEGERGRGEGDEEGERRGGKEKKSEDASLGCLPALFSSMMVLVFNFPSGFSLPQKWQKNGIFSVVTKNKALVDPFNVDRFS